MNIWASLIKASSFSNILVVFVSADSLKSGDDLTPLIAMKCSTTGCITASAGIDIVIDKQQALPLVHPILPHHRDPVQVAVSVFRILHLRSHRIAQNMYQLLPSS